MLKKCVALASTVLLGAVMVVGFTGCDNKPKAPATPAAGGAAPADGGAAPATPPAANPAPAEDHK